MSKRIAVVDDDPDVTQVLKATLKSRGYEVFIAYDGEEGLNLVEREKPDLLLLDLMMPRMSGLEVCKKMRENPETKHIPIIVLSAVGEKTDKPEEFWRMGLGADDFISKPFEAMTLLGRIEAVLRQSSYVSSKGGAGGEGAASVPKALPKDMTPREVIRCFVEAWNSRNFADEYDCLAESMRGPLEKAEYVARRQGAYAEEGASPHSQRVLKVLEEEVTGEIANVAIDREDTVGKRAMRRREEYTLKKTENGWKISAVRIKSK